VVRSGSDWLRVPVVAGYRSYIAIAERVANLPGESA
jgi:hypothetical protein